jgi:hypothetical protein
MGCRMICCCNSCPLQIVQMFWIQFAKPSPAGPQETTLRIHETCRQRSAPRLERFGHSQNRQCCSRWQSRSETSVATLEIKQATNGKADRSIEVLMHYHRSKSVPESLRLSGDKTGGSPRIAASWSSRTIKIAHDIRTQIQSNFQFQVFFPVFGNPLAGQRCSLNCRHSKSELGSIDRRYYSRGPFDR